MDSFFQNWERAQRRQGLDRQNPMRAVHIHGNDCTLCHVIVVSSTRDFDT